MSETIGTKIKRKPEGVWLKIRLKQDVHRAMRLAALEEDMVLAEWIPIVIMKHLNGDKGKRRSG